MKHFTISALFLVFIFTFTFTPFILAQDGLSREKKIEMIDKQIEEAQDAKTVGIYLAIGGVAAQVVGWAIYDPIYTYSYDSYSGSTYNEPDNTLPWILIGAGTVASIWGAYKWWDNANELSMLKTKRYDISFNPIIKIDQYGHMNTGINMHIAF